MRTSAVAGIIFANNNEELLGKLTESRAMSALPFGSRYRLIDFPLSNLVNAGVTNVGIITKENYRSLMDHIESGLYWDLDRKNGGIYLLTPYVNNSTRRYNGTVDALHSAIDYIERCQTEYIILCDGDTVSNVDLSKAVDYHISAGADVTLVYHKGSAKKCCNNKERLVIDSNRVIEIKDNAVDDNMCDYYAGYTVISRTLLLKIIKESFTDGQIRFMHDVLASSVKKLKIYGWEHKEYIAVMASPDCYFKASMSLLNSDVRRQLFNKNRPIFTKTRDDMPTRYGTKSVVSNCFIADGCIIDGTVKNSIVFRGVTVEKGAVVENCILMQETSVGANAVLENVVTDKNARIGSNMMLKGKPDERLLIEKNQTL